jgi:hypothetical protein
VISSEFNVDSNNFFERNYGIFDDQDDFKHEYKQMYEDYFSIIDKTICARLKQFYRYSESDIEEFFNNFELNKEAYEANNSDTFDVLYPIIDFKYFKKSMTDFKKSSKQNAEAVNEFEQHNKSSNELLARSAGGSDAAAAMASFKKILSE